MKNKRKLIYVLVSILVILIAIFLNELSKLNSEDGESGYS